MDEEKEILFILLKEVFNVYNTPEVILSSYNSLISGFATLLFYARDNEGVLSRFTTQVLEALEDNKQNGLICLFHALYLQATPNPFLDKLRELCKHSNMEVVAKKYSNRQNLWRKDNKVLVVYDLITGELHRVINGNESARLETPALLERAYKEDGTKLEKPERWLMSRVIWSTPS